MNFTSHYDAPVRLAALLVNATTPGAARGRVYRPPPGPELASDVLRSVVAGLAPLSDVEADRLAGFCRVLRQVFAAVSTGDLDAAAASVNRLLDRTGARPVMARHDEQPWHVHVHGTGGPATEWAGACAAGLGVVLGSDARHRLGLCTAPRCDRVYVDTSHNGSRRFCSTACQNRVKAAAFRARGQAAR